MIFLRPNKRRVPSPEPVERHQSENPMFTAPSAEWSQFRQRVLMSTLVVFVVGVAIGLSYGPWLRITEVTVSGTRLLDPQSVTHATEQLLDQRRWGILPNRTIWIVSSRYLEAQLGSRIRQRLSVESVVVEKLPPHGLHVTVAERTPVAIWSNGTSFGTIDRQGIIIESRASIDTGLPTIRDESARMFAPDASVVKPEVMTAIGTLIVELKKANIAVQEYLIPDPVCPSTVAEQVVTNTNTSSNRNGNANGNTNTGTNLNRNTNTAVLPAIICDRDVLRFSSQEIHVQLADGPRVLFDRQAKLNQSVQALKRVLSEKQEKTPTTIDVRFGDRVYIQ